MPISHLINANTHRVKEGARVLEDVARFVLRDEHLFKALRTLRHSLQTTPPMLSELPDLGGPVFKEENIRSNLIDLVQANALRIQEALRVLEEVTQEEFNKQKIKSLRYTAYQIQTEIYHKTLLLIKRDKLQGLYVVLDTNVIDLPLEAMINIINQSSINIVQLRNKLLAKKDFLNQAIQIRDKLHPDKLFIINDAIDVALDVAHGVHLGQEDYPIERVRKLLPDHFVLGVSCHHLEEAKLAMAAGASYLSIGCLFPTQSKKDIVPTSLTELKRIKASASIPICAIGGINSHNLNEVLSNKIDMIGVISAIWQTPNHLETIESMQEQIRAAMVLSKT